LVAVSKTHPAEAIQAAMGCGLAEFGENRVQEAEQKIPIVGREATRWHLIGHLQSNKASSAAELFHAIDSVDSLRVARRLNAAAQERGKTLPVLIEINIGGEQAKSGVAPASPELQELLGAAPDLPSLEIRGLMTVPPYSDDPEASRDYFRRTRALFAQIESSKLPGIRMETLSMGMSHDFQIAIEEGSTLVRVGTAIFGERPAL